MFADFPESKEPRQMGDMKQVHTEDSEILGAIMQYLVAQATWCCIHIKSLAL
jgi:hypothetical protein